MEKMPVHNGLSWMPNAAVNNLLTYGVRGLVSMVQPQITDFFEMPGKVAAAMKTLNENPEDKEASRNLEMVTTELKQLPESLRLTLHTSLEYFHFAAGLFSNEEFVVKAPVSDRPRIRRLGKALQDLLETSLDPNGPIAATYRLAEAAKVAPDDVFQRLKEAVPSSPSI